MITCQERNETTTKERIKLDLLRCWKGCSEDTFSRTKYTKLLGGVDGILWEALCTPRIRMLRQSPMAWQCHGAQTEASGLRSAIDPCLSMIQKALLVVVCQSSKILRRDISFKGYFSITKTVLNNIYWTLPMPKNSADNNLGMVIQLNV